MNFAGETSLETADGWARVERFERPARVVLAGRDVVLLDVASASGAASVRLHDEHGVMAGTLVNQDRRVFFVASGKAIMRFDSNGDVISVVELADLPSEFPDDGGVPDYDGETIEQIGWSFDVSSDGHCHYFEWSSSRTVNTYVGRLDLHDGRLDWSKMHPGYSVVFDPDDAAYFSVWPYTDPGVMPGVYAESFDHPSVESWPIEGMYFNLRFSPDRTQLLASGAFPDEDVYPLHVIDRATGEGRTLDLDRGRSGLGRGRLDLVAARGKRALGGRVHRWTCRARDLVARATERPQRLELYSTRHQCGRRAGRVDISGR